MCMVYMQAQYGPLDTVPIMRVIIFRNLSEGAPLSLGSILFFLPIPYITFFLKLNSNQNRHRI